MPSLSCSVRNCSHNESSLCNLNCIDVSGGASKENTCCSSFTESTGASNCSSCGSASPQTSISCKATDCSHNESCSCHADSVDVCSCGSACNCKDTLCSSYKKD